MCDCAQPFPSNIVMARFLEILILRVKNLKNKKLLKIFRFFSLEILNILKIRDSSFVSLLILRHVI